MPENSDFYPQVMQRYISEPSFPGEHTEFIATLLRVFEEKLFSAREFDLFPVEMIVDYIQRTHIFYFEKKLPEIEQSILLLSGHYDSHHPILAALQNFFHRYVQDLSEHIQAEEHLLLPYIKAVLWGCREDLSPIFHAFLLARRDYSVDPLPERTPRYRRRTERHPPDHPPL